MSPKCYSIAFKLRAVVVMEPQSYLFHSVAVSVINAGLESMPVSNKRPYKICM